VPRAPWLSSLVAGAVVIAVGGCTHANKTEVALTLKVDQAGEQYRPDYVLLRWRGGGGRDLDRRVPDTGRLASAGQLLGTILIELDDGDVDERLVIVKGMKDDGRIVSGAWACMRYESGQRQEIALTMGAWVDADGDDVPDNLDMCRELAGLGADAGTEDAAGDLGDAAEADAAADAASAAEADAVDDHGVPEADAASDARPDGRRRQ
jgi:hypothetical protein